MKRFNIDLAICSVVFIFLAFLNSVSMADPILYDSVPTAYQTDYTYDDLGRLTQMTQADGYTITYITFEYDEVGNCTRKTISTIQDTDGDQIPDGWETAYGLDPNDPADALQDLDQDGLTNLDEYNSGTDPTLVDTDGDGFPDGAGLQEEMDPLQSGLYLAGPVIPSMGRSGFLAIVFGAMVFGFMVPGFRYSFGKASRSAVRLLIVAAVFLASANAYGDAAGPGWIDAYGEQVTPEEAKAYYQSVSALEARDMMFAIQGDAAEATPEIIEMARALQYDPKLIYEYVRNHVDYVPYFGSLKGATLTYLDGSGNDFDQASLLIALLRESGYTAEYVYGQMWIPAYGASDQKDMQHWLGVDPSSAVISQVLGNGGIPAVPSASYYAVNRVWVQAEISGGIYLFDPAFKAYEQIQGIDLAGAMDYDQSSLLSSAGGSVGADYIENLNEAGLRGALDGYSLNLADYIRANYPNAYMEEIIGGRSIIPHFLDELPTSLDFATSVQETWTDIPDTYAHKVRIQHGQIDETFNIADLAGSRLSITYREAQSAVAALSAEAAALPDPEFTPSPIPVKSEPVETGVEADQMPEPAESEVQLPSIRRPGKFIGGGTEGGVTLLSGTWNFGKISPTGYSQGTMNMTNPNSVTIKLVVSLSSNPTGAYSIISGGGTVNVGPGATHSITVRFNGSGQTPGTKTGTLRVEWWYGGSRFADDYTGLTGVVAHPLTLGGYGMNVVTYLNQPIVGTCRLQNNGTLPLTINSMSLTGANPGRFQFVSGNGSGTIAAGGYRDIQVRYLANAHGTHTASIAMSLTYDGLAYSGDILSLQGKAVYAPDLTGSYGFNAGQRYLNDPVEGVCRLINNGSLNLVITGIDLAGTDAGRFEILSGGTGTLAPGQYRDIDVRYLADATGSHSANVHAAFTYDGMTQSIDLGLAGETAPTPPAQLWLDDELIFEESEPVTGSDLGKMTLSIDHPYSANSGTFCDQSAEYNLKRGSTYAVIYDFGGSRLGRLLEKRQRRLQTYRASGLTDTSRQVLTETLNVLGMTWMRDTTLNDLMLQQIAGVIDTRHHRFGVVAQETGYYIDVKAQMSSTGSIHGDDISRDAYFKATGHLASAMEHGVLEQMQVDRPSVSTVKLLQLTNSQGGRVYEVTAANYAAIQPLLTGYSSQDLADFQASVDDGAILILPQNGQITLLEWAGKGYIDYKIDAAGSHVGMIIGGDYHGGYGAIQAPVAVTPVYQETSVSVTPKAEVGKLAAGEPVDMVTGAWMHDHTDLTLTGGLGGLSLKRAYYSANNNMSDILGYGWSHNYNLYAEVHSSSEFGLGRRTPLDAAALITASVATLDILSGDADLKAWMAGALTAKWAMDQLTDNAVSVHLENDVLTYTRLPDGSFALPPGVTSQLVKDGDLYRVDERFDRSIAFNSDHQVSQITDADGNRIVFTYSDGKLQNVADDFGHSLTLSYSGDLLTSVSDSAGRSVSYGYDAADNLTTFTDPEGKVWTYGYDGNHRVLTLQDPLLITTITNAYDDLGRVKTQTAPRQNGSATYHLYFSGYRNVEEDPEGGLTVYHFDEQKRLVATEDALGHKTARVYDGQNHVIAETDPRNNTTTYEYDGNHNLIRVTDALANEIVNTYDGQFRLTDVTDPLGHVTHNDYDGEHHLIKATTWSAPGQPIEVAKTYLANGLVNTSSDGRGIVTTFTYDSYGNPVTKQTASAPAITYDYDAIGRMLSLTDQVGSQTSFAYDDRSLLLSRTDPLLKTASLAYYDDGKVYTQTDRNFETTTYTYTPTGKSETVSYQDGSLVSYTYDQHDNLIEMQDALGVATYSYDEVKRLTGSTDANNFAVSYAYDEAGNLIGLTYPGNKTVSYTYDELNRLETVTIEWLGKTATYNYDNAGRLTGMIQFNGTVAQFDYDDADRLTDLENLTSEAGNVIAAYHFTLDANGNRTHVDQQVPLALTPADMNMAFAYNSQRNRLLSAGSIDFAYDDEGQLTAKSADAYAFDAAHRLISIAGEDSYEFFYDGADNRLQTDRDGVVIRYIYDASGNLLAEADGSGAITRYYIHGAGLLAIVTPAGDLYCYHFDATGHTVALTDAAKTVVNQYAYTPFGTIADQVEAVAQPFKYVGQYGVMTEPNGLYYMRARYYDPQVGRFISEDPLGFDGGDVNLYAYARNNPILFSDPTGEFNWVGMGVGAISGAISGFAAGAKSGNIWAGIGGGVVGAVVGGGVGMILPQASGYASAAVVGAISGAVGGGTGSGTATALAGGNLNQIAKSAGQGAIVGGITGAAGGAIGQLTKIGLGAEAATKGGQFAEAWTANTVNRSMDLLYVGVSGK